MRGFCIKTYKPKLCLINYSTDNLIHSLNSPIHTIAAAFEQGADIVEFDVHRTTDDRFAVFHDWTVDCRTDGQGITHDHSLAELQALDIGYGYTADGGKTYPFRGQGCGMMPSMAEVLTTFPDKDFMIDIKSGIASEGVLLAERLAVYQQSRTGKLMVYGGGEGFSTPYDDLDRARQLPASYSGGIWTDRIEVMAPVFDKK